MLSPRGKLPSKKGSEPMSKANKSQNGGIDFTTWDKEQWKEVQTCDGYPAEILAVDCGGGRPILAKFEDPEGNICSGRMQANGVFHKEGAPFLLPLNGKEEEIDLFEQGFGYCNFRERPNGSIEGGVVYATLAEATKRATDNSVVVGVRVPLS
jgi:hypothetical protein